MNPPYVAVISAGRPQNVPLMEGHLEGIPHQWVVPAGQEGDYEYAGAPSVTGVHSTQDTHQRNHALRIAGPLRYCIQIDDDLRALHFVIPSQAKRPCTMQEAIDLLIKACEVNDAYYAGVAPTDNAYFTRSMFNLSGFIRSALTAYRPGSGLFYDDQFPLKGDYDLTLQHLTKFGKVARVDSLLASFRYGQGSGGCVAYRTPALEQEVIEKLMAKWPDNINPNPKRPGEVRLRWRGQTEEPTVDGTGGEEGGPRQRSNPADSAGAEGAARPSDEGGMFKW